MPTNRSPTRGRIGSRYARAASCVQSAVRWFTSSDRSAPLVRADSTARSNSPRGRGPRAAVIPVTWTTRVRETAAQSTSDSSSDAKAESLPVVDHPDRARGDAVLDEVRADPAALAPADVPDVHAVTAELARQPLAPDVRGQRRDPRRAVAEPRQGAQHVGLGPAVGDVELPRLLEPRGRPRGEPQHDLAGRDDVEQGLGHATVSRRRPAAGAGRPSASGLTQWRGRSPRSTRTASSAARRLRSERPSSEYQAAWGVTITCSIRRSGLAGSSGSCLEHVEPRAGQEPLAGGPR